jgi:hypothetical protein
VPSTIQNPHALSVMQDRLDQRGDDTPIIGGTAGRIYADTVTQAGQPGYKKVWDDDGPATLLLNQRAAQADYDAYIAWATASYVQGGAKAQYDNRLQWAKETWNVCPKNPKAHK